MFKRFLVLSILVLTFLSAFSIGFVSAQEAETTPEATVPIGEFIDEQQPVVVVQSGTLINTDDAVAIVIISVGAISIISALFMYIRDRDMTKFHETFRRNLESREVIDNATAQYLKSSILVQDLVELAKNGVYFFSRLDVPGLDDFAETTHEFLDTVTSAKGKVEKDE